MSKIIDSDGHIVEPRAIWQEYAEPAFRDLIPQVMTDEEGVVRIKVDGKIPPRSHMMFAGMCVPDGLKSTERARKLTWDDVLPASFEPHERIKVMDSEGIDVSILYGSLGLTYSAREPAIAAAACRAYNNWAADFCRPYPNRLYSVAPVPLIDVDAAITEMRRVVKDHGAKSVTIRPNPYNNRHLSDPAYEPFWAEAQELDCTIAVHSAVSGDLPTAGFERYQDFFRRMMIAHPFEQMMGAMDLISGGVLERYPRLRFAVLEAGGAWVPYWLNRMDEFFEKIDHGMPMKLKPSEYFMRQFFVSCEPEDVVLKMVEHLGLQDIIMWASDFPHFDCEFPGVVEELKEHTEHLSEETRRKIEGDNAARCYGLT